MKNLTRGEIIGRHLGVWLVNLFCKAEEEEHRARVFYDGGDVVIVEFPDRTANLYVEDTLTVSEFGMKIYDFIQTIKIGRLEYEKEKDCY